MTVRFAHIAVGQRFALAGETFVKVNSLIARHETGGGQQLIPRSEEVEPLAGSDTPSAQPAATLTPALRAAFDDFHAASLACVEQLAAGTVDIEQAREALAEARRKFLAAT